MFDFVKEPSPDQRHGVAVRLLGVVKVKGLVLKKPYPIDGEPHRNMHEVHISTNTNRTETQMFALTTD